MANKPNRDIVKGRNMTGLLAEAQRLDTEGSYSSSRQLKRQLLSDVAVVQTNVDTVQTGVDTNTANIDVNAQLSQQLLGLIVDNYLTVDNGGIISGNNVNHIRFTGAGVTLTIDPSGAVVVNVPSSGGGGGGSPYTIPLKASFVEANIPAGSTVVDKPTCLLLDTPSAGGVNLYALEDTVVPGATFTLTLGFDYFAYNNTGIGLFAMDGAKVFAWGLDTSAAWNGNLNYWNSYSAFNSNILNSNPYTVQSRFIRLVYDGTNLKCYSGIDMNSQVLIHTESATLWIGAPVKVGMYIFGYTGPMRASMFHYTHTA